MLRHGREVTEDHCLPQLVTRLKNTITPQRYWPTPREPHTYAHECTKTQQQRCKMKQSLFSAIPSVNYKGKNAKTTVYNFSIFNRSTYNKYASWNKMKGYTLSGILQNVSSFILCSISARGQEQGGLLVLRAVTKSPFHISLEHFRNGWTINNFRKATPSLKAISALLSLVLVQ